MTERDTVSFECKITQVILLYKTQEGGIYSRSPALIVHTRASHGRTSVVVPLHVPRHQHAWIIFNRQGEKQSDDAASLRASDDELDGGKVSIIGQPVPVHLLRVKKTRARYRVLFTITSPKKFASGYLPPSTLTSSWKNPLSRQVVQLG